MFLKGYKFASPGALVALVCFFLPWVLVSCMGQPVAEFSGLEIATGPELNTAVGSEKYNAFPWLFLIPLTSLLVFLLAFLSSRRQQVNMIDKLVVPVSGLVALGSIILLSTMLGDPEFQREAQQMGVRVDSRFGILGTVLGLLLVIIGGVINWFGTKASESTPSSS